MVFPQSVIAFRRQSVLPQAGLEIIAFHRKVIGIAGSFRLLQGGIFPVGIHTAVIHIISDQICPGSQHTDRLCLDVLRIRVSTPVCRYLQSPSQLRCEIREFRGIKGKTALTLRKIRSNIGIIVKRLEQEILTCRKFMGMICPRGIHIPAQHRQETSRHIGTTPAGCRHIRGFQSLFLRHGT